MKSALVNGSRLRAITHQAIAQPSDDVRCLVCGGPAHLALTSSGPHFAHSAAGKPGQLLCPVRSENERRFSWSESGERDPGFAEGLRQEFLASAFLPKAFSFASNLLRKRPALTVDAFARLISIADALDIWSLRDMHQDLAAQLLPSFDDFQSTGLSGDTFLIRYALERPRGLMTDQWRVGKVLLRRYFLQPGGEPTAAGDKAVNREFLVSSKNFTAMAGDSSWVSQGAIAGILRRVGG